jgi:hypothetical protein
MPDRFTAEELADHLARNPKLRVRVWPRAKRGV